MDKIKTSVKETEDPDIQDLREDFLREAHKVLLHELAKATGQTSPLTYGDFMEEKHAVIYKDVLEMIKQTEGRMTVQAGSVRDIIKAVSTGKLSLPEARELMILWKMSAEISALENGGGTGIAPQLYVNLCPADKEKAKQDNLNNDSNNDSDATDN